MSDRAYVTEADHITTHTTSYLLPSRLTTRSTRYLGIWDLLFKMSELKGYPHPHMSAYTIQSCGYCYGDDHDSLISKVQPR